MARFSPPGTRVVTASEDQTARVWGAAGEPLSCPLEHQGVVWAAAFSPDGMRVVTASLDRTARVWDIRLDEGTVEEWTEIAKRSPFVLDGTALVRRSSLPSVTKPGR
jgi:WD40 repeat protein